MPLQDANPTPSFGGFGVKHLLIARKNEFITRQRISELTQEVVPVGELDDILIVDPIRLVDFDWNRELLTLVLNHPVNDGWIWALGHMGDHSSLLARIHRRTPMDGVRKAEGGVRELQGK